MNIDRPLEFVWEDPARLNACRVTPAPSAGLLMEVAHASGPSQRRSTSSVLVPREQIGPLLQVVMTAAGWGEQEIGAAMDARAAVAPPTVVPTPDTV